MVRDFLCEPMYIVNHSEYNYSSNLFGHVLHRSDPASGDVAEPEGGRGIQRVVAFSIFGQTPQTLVGLCESM